jgi:hypothetical protein
MLILPPGHAEEVARRRAFSGRERWMIRGVMTLVVVGIIALVVSFATAGKKTSHGCVSVALAYSTGGSQIYRCGAGARALCSAVGRAGGITGKPAQALAVECRKAGITVG